MTGISYGCTRNVFSGTSCRELNIPDAHVSLFGSLPVDTKVIVTCSKPHVLIGRREVTCQSNGDWSELPQCWKYGKLLQFFFQIIKKNFDLPTTLYLHLITAAIYYLILYVMRKANNSGDFVCFSSLI